MWSARARLCVEETKEMDTLASPPSTSVTRKTFVSRSTKLSDINEVIRNPKRSPINTLLVANLILGVLHAILAIGFGGYLWWKNLQQKCVAPAGEGAAAARGFETDVRIHVVDPKRNEYVSEKDAALQPPSNIVPILVTLFFGVTSAAHFAYATNFNSFYIDEVVKGGRNRFRWVEYGISATIMMIIIAFSSGVKDAYALVMIAAAVASVMFTGYWFEQLPKSFSRVEKSVPIFVGFFLLFSVFLVVWWSFNDRVEDYKAITAAENADEFPSWIRYMIFVLFAFYASFGFVPVAQLVFPSASFLRFEGVYLVLSVAAKATLGGFLAYGYSQRA